MRTHFLVALIALPVLGLGCQSDSLVHSSEESPEILTVHAVLNGTDTEQSISGGVLDLIASVTGGTSSCLEGKEVVLKNAVRYDVFVQVPNTKSPLTVVGTFSPTGGAPSGPVVSFALDPTVVYNKPGSAQGVIKIPLRISEIPTIGGAGVDVCGIGVLQYQYEFSVSVTDRDGRTDAANFPVAFSDTTSARCTEAMCTPPAT